MEADEQILRAFELFEPELREYSRAQFDGLVQALSRKYRLPQHM